MGEKEREDKVKLGGRKKEFTADVRKIKMHTRVHGSINICPACILIIILRKHMREDDVTYLYHEFIL
jgi:hypothetical protein